MSVTTTANPVGQTVLRALADYELTHSGEELNISHSNKPPNSHSAAETRRNLDCWPTDYEGIPSYRPINYNLDREQRPWARPGAETAFVFVMLNGVGTIAVSQRE